MCFGFGGECVFKNVVEYYNKIKFRHATAANNRLLAAQLQAFEPGCVLRAADTGCYALGSSKTDNQRVSTRRRCSSETCNYTSLFKFMEPLEKGACRSSYSRIEVRTYIAGRALGALLSGCRGCKAEQKEPHHRRKCLFN